MDIENVIFKVVTKYLYENNYDPQNPGEVLFKPGDFILKQDPLYEVVEGDEITLKDLGELYIAVDKMLYDFSNQWEEGMDPDVFLENIRSLMRGIRYAN